MTLPQYRRWLDNQLKEAEPLDRPSELENPRGVAIEAAKRLGRFGYGSGELHERAHRVDSPAACAAVLIDCLAALPEADDVESQSERAMSIAEVAEILGVSKSTVYRLTNEQILPYDRVRGRKTITPQQLAAYRNQ